MTATVLPAEALPNLKPEFIVPLVVYLCHDSCQETGSMFELVGGYIAKLRWQRSEGSFFNLPFTAEEVNDKFNEITDFSRNSEYPTASSDIFPKVTENLERMKNGPVNKTPATSSVENSKNFAQIDTRTDLRSEQIFSMMREYLARGEGKGLIPKIDAVFNFDIQKEKGGPVIKTWIIDLKNANGDVKVGKVNNADASFTMTDADFEAVCLGKLNPQNAFLQVISQKFI